MTFSGHEAAKEVALRTNNSAIRLQDNQTRGTTYYRYIFSEDAVVANFVHGEGKKDGRFAVHFLISGTAHKVGRDENELSFYNESIEVF